MTQPDTVEYFRFRDRPGGERFVLALEGPKSDRVSSGILFYGFDVFSLLPGFPDLVSTWDEGAGEVKKDRLDGLGGVGGSEDGGQGGELSGVPVAEADPMSLGGENQLYDVREEALLQVRSARVMVKLSVQLSSALVEERVRAQTEDVVVSVVGAAIGRGT